MRGEIEYTETCPKCSGYGKILPTCPYPINSISTSQEYYLFLVQAYVRNDGEHRLRGPGDIGLLISGGENYKEKLFDGRMYGPFDEGWDDNQTIKLEWKDYCTR